MRRDIGFSPFFDLENRLFLPYLPTSLAKKLKFGMFTTDVSFGDSDFSAPSHPLQPQKCGWSFLFCEFLLRITTL